jgi:hypothetical protein
LLSGQKIMAAAHLVKQYLAQWFQLGQKVCINNGQTPLSPQRVFLSDNYTAEFESCWQQAIAPESGDCYLEGTSETIAELLSPAWDIVACARCQMPVPLVVAGVSSLECPCASLQTWPNNEVPQPISPLKAGLKLVAIHNRLHRITV